MGQQQSRYEFLCQQAAEGNIVNIKALCSRAFYDKRGGFERVDRKGYTALIVASVHPSMYVFAKTLIEMGANVNAYRPGSFGGTPLHHAAKRGLDQTVRLLLSHGANAYAENDDHLTPLDIARVKGYNNVVRAIEEHMCYFSGHVFEILAPGLFGKLSCKLLSRNCWAVVLPCEPPNQTSPPMLNLAIYPTEQDPMPQAIIPLWKSKIDIKFHQADPLLTVFDLSSKIHHKFAPTIVGDKQQLLGFYNACRGISQILSEAVGLYTSTPSAPPWSYDDGPTHGTLTDVVVAAIRNEAFKATGLKDDEENVCVICWEAPIEGACVPCGHMAGCMSCFNGIKAGNGECLVCRAKINQVVRLYAV